jgi:DNA modification methylase
VDAADDFEVASGPGVSKQGDVWILGAHRLSCGTPLDPACYTTILAGETAGAVFTTPCCDTNINNHASGEATIAGRDFRPAGDAIAEADFAGILSRVPRHLGANCRDGAFLYICTDWQQADDWIAAARDADLHLLDLCIWTRTKGGIGPFYRSHHELVFVFKNGQASDVNRIKSGRAGPNRSNVWSYPASFSHGKGGLRRDPYPIAKPIALIADAILDCTVGGDIVLDPFVGGGTTILAAERTGRRCYGIEKDPRNVDTAIQRWQRFAGRAAHDGRGRTFDEIAFERGGRP